MMTALKRISAETILVIEHCYHCGTPFGIESGLQKRFLQEGGTFYCPLGHGQIYAASTVDRLKQELTQAAKKLEQAETNARYYADRAEEALRSNSALRGVVTRTKNRIANGVCPCCNRHFENLHRHMTTKHPEYKEREDGRSG